MKWIEDGSKGFWELKFSHHDGQPPIFLLRAVRNSNDQYEGIVRDAQNGYIVASRGKLHDDVRLAMADALKLTINLTQHLKMRVLMIAAQTVDELSFKAMAATLVK